MFSELLARSAQQDEKGSRLLIVSWVEFSVATLLLLLRFYVQFFVKEFMSKWILFWAGGAWVGQAPPDGCFDDRFDRNPRSSLPSTQLLLMFL